MASNLIASSGTKLATVGAQGTSLSRLRSFAPTAGYILPVAVQGSSSFPLRWSAATRLSLLPQQAKTGDAREGSDKEREEYEVHNFLSSWAQRAKIMLLSIVSLLQKEDVEAAIELERHFSQLIATADSKGGDLETTAAVRGLIAGAHRLIELAYKSSKFPRLSTKTTDEVFIDYFISNGNKASVSEMAFAGKMKKYQVSKANQRYLGSMQASMNLAKTVVDGVSKKTDAMLQMFPILDEEDLKGFSVSPFPKGFPWDGIFY